MYLVNLSEKDYIRKKNKHLGKIAEWIKEHAAGDPILPISICLEERLTRFDTDAEVKEELKTLGVDSALPKIITTMRKALHLGSFFTTGTDEVRQWTIRDGTKAPQAAGVIHGDFEKTFIQAIVYNFTVLKELGDEAEVKAKGKIQTKGKDYVVEDGGTQRSTPLRSATCADSRRYPSHQGRSRQRIEFVANSMKLMLLLHRQSCLMFSKRNSTRMFTMSTSGLYLLYGQSTQRLLTLQIYILYL